MDKMCKIGDGASSNVGRCAVAAGSGLNEEAPYPEERR
jgi:hypothetical protein